MKDNAHESATEPAFELRSVTRRFKDTVALDRLNLRVEPGQIVGLIGRNGSGKTTLLRHVVGLQLATAGEVRTLGAPSERLGSSQLGRIGMVHQEIELPGWMRVERMLRYVASYHARWSLDREARLIEELEIDPAAKVGTLTPGNLQKVALVLAVCPRSELLLLDEPVSALDPIVRERLLSFLIELLREDGSTIVISSHVLRDVERVVDWIVCLERGRVIADVAMDELRERYAEWRLISTNGDLPGRFDEPFVLRQQSDERSARLEVRRSGADALTFGARHHALVEERPLDLERIFPLLLQEART